VRKRWRIEGDGDEESEEEEDVNAEGNTDSEAEVAGAEEQPGRRKRRSRTMTLVIVNGSHQCIGAAVRTHRSSSCQDWLDGAVTRHMKVTRDTTPKQIVDMLQVEFLEQVSEKVAALCRHRLLKSDLGSQRQSFVLLPAYERCLQEASPTVYTDLFINRRTGKSLLLL
jgi:hypothetical protein